MSTHGCGIAIPKVLRWPHPYSFLRSSCHLQGHGHRLKYGLLYISQYFLDQLLSIFLDVYPGTGLLQGISSCYFMEDVKSHDLLFAGWGPRAWCNSVKSETLRIREAEEQEKESHLTQSGGGNKFFHPLPFSFYTLLLLFSC